MVANKYFNIMIIFLFLLLSIYPIVVSQDDFYKIRRFESIEETMDKKSITKFPNQPEYCAFGHYSQTATEHFKQIFPKNTNVRIFLQHMKEKVESYKCIKESDKYRDPKEKQKYAKRYVCFYQSTFLSSLLDLDFVSVVFPNVYQINALTNKEDRVMKITACKLMRY